MTDPERSDHPLRVALARHRVGRLASSQPSGRPSRLLSIMRRTTVSGRYWGLVRKLADVTTSIQVGACPKLWRRTTSADRSSILHTNQALRGPAPAPSDAYFAAVPMAFDTTQAPSHEHQVPGHRSRGSGATEPDHSGRTLTLGAKRTMPSPRLVSLPIRGVRDEIARSFCVGHKRTDMLVSVFAATSGVWRITFGNKPVTR
jgi:hypothetical protein